VGTKPFFLKAIKDPSTVPSWPPQWLVDIEHISYILPIVGIREYEGRTYIQTPLQHCNLRTWLEYPENRTQKNIQRIFAQLLFALDWLGEYGKFLGSIKPENVFISSGNAIIDVSYHFPLLPTASVSSSKSIFDELRLVQFSIRVIIETTMLLWKTIT
jgi:serine/threonine protein kinase